MRLLVEKRQENFSMTTSGIIPETIMLVPGGTSSSCVCSSTSCTTALAAPVSILMSASKK